MGKYFTSDPKEVSARMRLIRGKDTKAELALFSMLSRMRVPFRRHVRIGRVEADAMIKERILVFVDSPFWHLRSKAELRRLSSYWRGRLVRNKQRDERQRRKLRKLGYSVLRLWTDDMNETKIMIRIQRALALNKESSGRSRGGDA